MSFDPAGRTAIVTGAARGIGLALGRALHDAGASVVLTDIDAAALEAAAGEHRLQWRPLDVTSEAAVAAVIDDVEESIGPVSLYCSNAGVLRGDGPDWSASAQDTRAWQQSFEVNVLAHVHAARALVPRMVARGDGAFLITASAAGLLSQTGDAAYSSTKHAALGFAEALAIAHGDEGLHVSALCPQGVDTAMLDGARQSSATLDGTLSTDDVAHAAVAGLREGRFMIQPHPQVATYFKAKADNYDRWLGGMRKLRRRQLATTGQAL